jgi:hypothetical protein
MRALFPHKLTVWFSNGLDKYGNPALSDAINIWGRVETVSGVTFGTQGISVTADSRFITQYPLRQPDGGWDDEWVVAIAEGWKDNNYVPTGTESLITGKNEIPDVNNRLRIWEIVR